MLETGFSKIYNIYITISPFVPFLLYFIAKNAINMAISDFITKISTLFKIHVLNRDISTKDNKIDEVINLVDDNNEFLMKLDESQQDKMEKLKDKKWKYSVLLSAMNKYNISKEKLINSYWGKLHTIILTFDTQKDEEMNTDKFVRDKLKEDYNLENLDSKTWVVPPKHVPDKLKKPSMKSKNIENWIENEIYNEYPNHKAKIYLASIADLNKMYSRNDHTDYSPFKSRLVKDVFDLEDLFDKDDITKILHKEGISIIELIEDGDIAFLASNSITTKELNKLIPHINEIEDELSNPSLGEIKTMNPSKIEPLIKEYVSDENDVSKEIVETANLFYDIITEVNSKK